MCWTRLAASLAARFRRPWRNEGRATLRSSWQIRRERRQSWAGSLRSPTSIGSSIQHGDGTRATRTVLVPRDASDRNGVCDSEDRPGLDASCDGSRRPPPGAGSVDAEARGRGADDWETAKVPGLSATTNGGDRWRRPPSVTVMVLVAVLIGSLTPGYGPTSSPFAEPALARALRSADVVMRLLTLQKKRLVRGDRGSLGGQAPSLREPAAGP